MSLRNALRKLLSSSWPVVRAIALIGCVTDLLVEVEGQGSPDFRRNVWVGIDEQESSHWSLGGLQPTAEIIASTFGAIGTDGVRIARR
ncbi:4-oxalocrotonate tautomerase [Bradyrhizobium sp. CIR18]|nr:4-oxalocrotonate tautomerase [Bradyrhizobium sp. CIR18]